MPELMLVGLDGAEPELLDAWCAEGLLPNIGRLQQQGSVLPVRVPRAVGDGAVWPSLYTGANPGKHGRVYLHQIVPGSYDIEPFPLDALSMPPVWQALGEAGRRVAVVDMVRAPFTPGLNGVQISEWLEHDGAARAHAWPDALTQRLQRLYADNPVAGSADAFVRRHADIGALVRCLEAQIEAKTAAMRELLAQEPWHFFTTVFGEAHDIGHVAWHLHDAGHHQHDAKWVATHGDPLLAIYRKLDAAVGELLDAAGSDTAMWLFAGIGMEANWSGNVVLDDVLNRLEGGGPPRLRNLYRRLLPQSIRWRARKSAVTGSLVTQARRAPRRRSRAGRRCFAVPHNAHSGAVRLNLRGREPAGRLARGREAEAFLDWLCDELMQLEDADSGRPVVQQVVRTDEVFFGERRDALPDLFVVWNRPQPFHCIRSPRAGEIRVSAPEIRTGDHSDRAALYTARPADAGDAGLDVLDIAPTIAARFGITLPQSDGRVVSGLL